MGVGSCGCRCPCGRAHHRAPCAACCNAAAICSTEKRFFPAPPSGPDHAAVLILKVSLLFWLGFLAIRPTPAIRAAIPGVLRLHRERLTERDVQPIDGVRVTTPLRTLVDVMVEGGAGKPTRRLDPTIWREAAQGYEDE